MLLDSGMTQRHLSGLAGLSEVTLKRLRSGDVPWIYASTERAILGIKPVRSVGAGRRVDATGARRRMQALMAIGYGSTELAVMLDMPKNAGPRIMRAELVVEETRVAVVALYERLAMKPPEDTWQTRRIRGFAAKHGYAPPLAWDEETIDDPSAKPAAWKRGQRESGFLTRLDESVVLAAIDGQQPELSPPERRRVIAVLHERRWSAGRIGSWIDCSAKTVDRIREELHLPIYDVADVRAAA
ncbi:hypothetical protein SK224_08080 [Microbacterium sp. BG28]|uniref:helix-turn-helix domain-containing protein n=1 Tax=Microbacterium sp. BG28 TaxID=3097356 RepID=UPI002A59D2AB|nr:hypothetical protein [Microbacterium sp. BG28]MDY0829085.1 hypothetical protein [Microbacterium sp. BG28]